MNQPIKRLEFGHLIDRVFWALITASVVYAAAQLKAVSDSVEQLNIKMAVVISQITYAEKRADAQDELIKSIQSRLRQR